MLINKDELISDYGCAENAVVLEPHEIFGKGIIGFTESPNMDGNIICYGYNKLVKALAEATLKEGHDKEEAEQMAIDWIEYNTLNSLISMDSAYRPVIIYEVEE